MNDHDFRQLTKMHQQIDSYRSGSIDLNILIADLMFLRDALTTVEKDWERIEKNAGKLNEMTQKIVDDTIPILLSLIDTIKPA
jgi:hypothetical protein